MIGNQHIEWRELQPDDEAAPGLLRRRLRCIVLGFVLGLVVIFGRFVQLETSYGAAFRRIAAAPLVRERSLAGQRGRILARDGTVLADDEPLTSLALAYRYLQQPPDPRWLRSMTRRRLKAAERRRPELVAAAEAQVLAERAAMHRELAALCGMTDDTWAARCAAIQRQVESMSHGVNLRRQENYQAELEAEETATTEQDGSWPALAARLLSELFDEGPAPPPGNLTLAEELRPHVVAESVPLAAIAAIQSQPQRFPGVQFVEATRRRYPQGAVASHLVGYLGRINAEELAAKQGEIVAAEDWTGRLGVERRYDDTLAPRRGRLAEQRDRRGKIVGSHVLRQPENGRDVRLTIDVELQRWAESALDAAIAARVPPAEEQSTIANRSPPGGAMVAIDIHTGGVLAAASAPRFDPNVLVRGDDDAIRELLVDPAHRLLDRTSGMALPPGSVFKPVTAVALVESGVVDAQTQFACRGFLQSPESWRCALYRRQGVGHGATTVGDALTQSCNVFFFHYAAEAGPAALLGWARQFGFGRPTGVDLPGEASGKLPTPADIRQRHGRAWHADDSRATAIGQGQLTATPLQVVRMMAALGNGGRLVTPHVVARDSDAASTDAPTIEDLRPETLAAIGAGLRRVVADPRGTAHALGQPDGVTLAGKTGTAEAGGSRGDHAWFAGYAPAEQPRVALVVVLEHGGNAGATAAPLARRLVERLRDRGLLGPASIAAEAVFPPGRG